VRRTLTTSMLGMAILVAAVVALAGVHGEAAEHAPKAASEAAFEQLTSLVGEWQGTQQGVAVTLTYTLTADGTALMEQMQPAGSAAMITMFTVDGERLLATHYCSAGNQPQMATGAIKEPETKSLTFSLVRVTGMKTPGDFHNTGVMVRLEDKDHLTQEWTYLDHGKSGTNVFRYERKR